jgi:hypothetical protein
MTPDDLDRALAHLRSGVARTGRTLVDTEADPTWQMLGQASLEGESASRLADATRALADVWHWYSELTALVERADELRGSKQGMTVETETTLREMLARPSIQLASTPIALADRDLFGPSRKVSRATPDELIGRMAAAFERVRAVIADATRAWDAYVPRLTAARAEFAAAVDAGRSLGCEERSELRMTGERLQQLAARLVADPLSVAAPELAAAEADSAAARTEIEAALALRDGVGQALADAEARLAELGEELAAAIAAHDETAVKIAGSPVAPPPDERSDLRGRLSDIAHLTEQGDWRGAHVRLTEWLGRVDDLISRARACRRDNRARIEDRNELRARLDAYRVKADRLGCIEEAEVSDAHERAEAALYTAPTDLDVAARLVVAYQRAVAGPAVRGGVG